MRNNVIFGTPFWAYTKKISITNLKQKQDSQTIKKYLIKQIIPFKNVLTVSRIACFTVSGVYTSVGHG